jgi:hypothetical protein
MAKHVDVPALPLLVQPLDSWGPLRHGSSGEVAVDVFPVEEPRLLDFAKVTEFSIIRVGLQHWRVGPSDVEGCLSIENPILAQAHVQYDVLCEGCPFLLVQD